MIHGVTRRDVKVEGEFFWNSMVCSRTLVNPMMIYLFISSSSFFFLFSSDRIILYLGTKQRRRNILMGSAVNEWNRIGWLLAICANDHLLARIITSTNLPWLMIVIFWNSYCVIKRIVFMKLFLEKCEISFQLISLCSFRYIIHYFKMVYLYCKRSHNGNVI